MQRHFALTAGIAPSRMAVLQDETVLRANPQFRAQLAMFHGAIERPRTPLYPAISNILQRYSVAPSPFRTSISRRKPVGP